MMICSCQFKMVNNGYLSICFQRDVAALRGRGGFVNRRSGGEARSGSENYGDFGDLMSSLALAARRWGR